MFGFNFFKRKKKNTDTHKKEQQQKKYPLKSNKPVLQSVSNEQQNLMNPLNPFNPIYVNISEPVSESKEENKCEPIKSEPVCSRYEDTNDRYSGGNDYGGGGGSDSYSSSSFD